MGSMISCLVVNKRPKVQPCQTVFAKFVFKPGKKEGFVEMLKGPDGLAKTRECKGCIRIECYDVSDDPNTLVIWQKWKTKEDHQAYLTMRQESGLMEILGNDLAEPLVPLYLDASTDF